MTTPLTPRDLATAADVARIYVFCNSCSPGWHSFVALAEDGTGLAGHICSHHGFAAGDMGVVGDNKHEHYAAHYPSGYVVEYVQIGSKMDVAAHAGLSAAIERAKAKAAEAERIAALAPEAGKL